MMHEQDGGAGLDQETRYREELDRRDQEWKRLHSIGLELERSLVELLEACGGWNDAREQQLRADEEWLAGQNQLRRSLGLAELMEVF